MPITTATIIGMVVFVIMFGLSLILSFNNSMKALHQNPYRCRSVYGY